MEEVDEIRDLDSVLWVVAAWALASRSLISHESTALQLNEE